MDTKDTVLTVNVVEPGLVTAVKELGDTIGVKLKGLVLVHSAYATKPGRKRDESGFFKEIICDFNDQAALQRLLKPYSDRLLAVICRYDSAMESFRKLIPFVPYVATPTETSLLWATDKSLMRDRLFAYDESLVPKYCHFTAHDRDHIDEVTADFTFPVIVKPNGLAESLLVSRCDDREALHSCLGSTFAVIETIYEREYRESQKPGVLIEEMMQGEMYSVDAYVSMTGKTYCLPPVRVITAHEMGLPGFYGYIRSTPTDLSADEVAAAQTASEAAIKALNLRATSVHVELFRTATGWKIIELGARIGGYREELYREAYGIQHYKNDLAVRMGLEPDMPGEPIAHAACIQMYAETEGVIESIDGVTDIEEMESVVMVTTGARPGDRAVFAENGGKYIVTAIFSHQDPEQLKRDIATARKRITIKVTPEPSAIGE